MATNISLAALYRPQTFAEVVGQDMVKSILSRASSEDRVAPAYLLSGTRGVGKTTIARIFAKALNCANAPAAEPCNQCDACRRITQGNYVDVVEIDGASNRGIDDIRRLRDAVGYAPLEGRYKVFIIDEAHMLTKEAFNALLKTLEEPPPRVTFILATTEQHKFPVTILSRCQHFVFRQIPENVLEEHVCNVLRREEREFEPEAPRLIARRASGSVRDSMSLLGQVLALGCLPGETLRASQVREVLGLAGREVMDRLLCAIEVHDTSAIVALVEELLAQGIDMGFFLREFTGLWRNIFLAGQGSVSGGAWSAQETAEYAALAKRFSMAFVHAAWQMTLDSQRRILTSLEPSVGLELLLLNLSMLPRLLPLKELSLPAEQAAKQRPAVPAPASVPPASPRLERAEESTEPKPAAPVPPPPVTVRNEVRAANDGKAGTPAARQPADSPAPVLEWKDFLSFHQNDSKLPMPLLQQMKGEVSGDQLILSPSSQVAAQNAEQKLPLLRSAVAKWAGRALDIVIRRPEAVMTEAESRDLLLKEPSVRKFQDEFGATIAHVM